jgi:arginyl-tRNA synthetase
MPQGKMSSRMGNVITAEDLVEEVKEKILEKIETSHKEVGDKKILAQDVAIGAIKYSILHQSIGKDIIFNFDTSLSFDGDSGPYLQYANARAHSLLEKAKIEGVLPDNSGDVIYPVERYIYQFPEIVLRAMQELAPQLIATYLIELAGSFNHLYAEHVIVDAKDPSSPKKVAITKAVHTILMNGLSILGIPTPKVM